MQRDGALDLLRGYFLFMIVVNHLRFKENLLYALTGRQLLFVTAAEGFILVSGFLVGKVRGADARTAGLAAAARRLWRRAVTLALWSALLTLIFYAVSRATGSWPEVHGHDQQGSAVHWILGAVTLRRTYGDHNLLAGYALYMAAAPLGLYLMLRGRTAVFLLLSVALWAASYRFELHWTGAFHVDGSWQILFVIGMVLGFHEAAIARRWQALAPATRRALFIIAGVLTAVTIALSWLRLPDGNLFPTRLEGYLFYRVRVGPGRIACALLWIGFFYAAARRHEALLARTVGRVLIPMGRASLYVYIMQSALVYVLVDRQQDDAVLGAAISLAVTAALYLMVRWRFLFAIVPR